MLVVNCFHFSVSLGYNTTTLRSGGVGSQLWIAFIFQYLWDTTQQGGYLHLHLLRCELLSFFSIFGIQHNSVFSCSKFQPVVNCFHFSVSLGYNTTLIVAPFLALVLWIAFIFQYLWDTTQLLRRLIVGIPRCELLSFFSIFGIQHNKTLKSELRGIVVNCFHFSVSLGYNTTMPVFLLIIPPLWIAFIFQYLWDTTQQEKYLQLDSLSCELLSFFSIFGIQHNFFYDDISGKPVVNCFHFSVSLGYNTTVDEATLIATLLWIAFIFQYLWDTTQHKK